MRPVDGLWTDDTVGQWPTLRLFCNDALGKGKLGHRCNELTDFVGIRQRSLRLPAMIKYLCEKLQSLGFSPGNQVRLYGRNYEIVCEPIVVTRNLVLVDALDADSGRIERVRIPLPIVRNAA